MAPVPEPGAFSELSADLLRLGHSVRFRASGESMHPTIRAGDVITVKPVAPSDLGCADIVLYRTGRGVIAHRVVRKVRRGDGMTAFLVRGDASSDSDEPVAEDQVLGKVVLVERGDRRITPGRLRVKFFHLARVYAYRLKRRMERLSQ